jgi:hypothetical protein
VSKVEPIPLTHPIHRNTTCLHQLIQYLHSCLRYGTISTDNLDKLIFQPAQVSVCLYNVPPQAGKLRHQQEINFPSGHRTGNLSQPTAGKVQSAGLFSSSTHNLKAVRFRICFQAGLLNRQRMGVRARYPSIYPSSFLLHPDGLLVNQVSAFSARPGNSRQFQFARRERREPLSKHPPQFHR